MSTEENELIFQGAQVEVYELTALRRSSTERLLPVLEKIERIGFKCTKFVFRRPNKFSGTALYLYEKETLPQVGGWSKTLIRIADTNNRLVPTDQERQLLSILTSLSEETLAQDGLQLVEALFEIPAGQGAD